MKQTSQVKCEEQQYFTFTDVVKQTVERMSKNPESSDQIENKEVSMSIISDLTYINVWNSFVKWCQDITELNNLIDIQQFCEMFYFSEKPLDGIAIKFSRTFLQKHQLIWDEDNSTYERNYKNKYSDTMPRIQKLNCNLISKDLDIKVSIVQTALANLFNEIGEILANNFDCLIDLGVFGTFLANNKKVIQIPSKNKGDSLNNKKTTIKSLMERRAFNAIEDEEEKVKVGLQGTPTEMPEFKKDFIHHSRIVPKNISFKIKPGGKPNLRFKNLQQSQELENNREENKAPLDIPMTTTSWKMKEMLKSTFKRIYKPKVQPNPVLFNDYSNTKAAPFTAEKTQIPLSHRIGSFYSLSLQDYIIDKTTKNIKRLCDEYFVRYQDIKFDKPATEEEEYLYYIDPNAVDSKKIEMKKNAFKRYRMFIDKSISNQCISEMNPKWLASISVKSKSFGFRKNSLRGEEVFNNYDIECQPYLDECVQEIQDEYCDSMKRAILNYILKHPEQKQKLNIPIEFKRIKEYAEEKISRPSDGVISWKGHWNRNKLAISNSLYIMCENVTKIMKYYTKNLKNTYYVRLEEDDSWPTKKLGNFIENQKKELEEQKIRVNNKWKEYVGTILRENRIYKDQLILYFKSVSGLMSSQLRELIIDSIKKYYNYLLMFKKDDYPSAEEILKNQFNSKTPFERSFIEIDIKEDIANEKFTFSDNLDFIHSQLKDIVTNIAKCSLSVERPDNIFIKNIEKHSHLWIVPVIDSVVTEMSIGIERVIEENINVINKVPELYSQFIFVLKENERIKEFLERKDPRITREEIKKRIAEYEEKIKRVNEMPNVLYMNMIKVNCKEINDTIRTKLDGFINKLLEHIRNKILIEDGKKLNEDILNMFQKCDKTIQNEVDVHDSEELLEKFSMENKKVYFETYDDIIEWFFFYLSYDTYDVFSEIKENSTGFDSTIRQLHEQLNKIEKTLKDFGDRINNEKSKQLKQLEDDKARYLKDIKEFKNDLDAFKSDLKMKRKSASTREKGKVYSRFFEDLSDKLKDAKEQELKFQELGEREFLLTNNQFEDETVKNCIDLLEPMISYFQFVEDYQNKFHMIKETSIGDLNLNELTELAKRDTVFEKEALRLPSSYSKEAIIDKTRYEKFFKGPYNLFKLLHPLLAPVVEINKKKEGENEAEKENHEEDQDEIDDDEEEGDNALYCHEIAQFFPAKLRRATEAESQDMLLNLTFYDIQEKVRDVVEREEEINPIIEEWQLVHQIHQEKKKIRSDFSKTFIIEKYKKKEFLEITKESFEDVTSALKKIIELAKEKLCLFKEEKYETIRGVAKINQYKKVALDTLAIVEKMNKIQTDIEKLIDDNSIVRRKDKPQNPGYFRNAQNKYGELIRIIEKEEKEINSVFNNMKVFETNLDEINKLLVEIQK